MTTGLAWMASGMNWPDDFLINTSSVLLPKQKSRASKIDVGLFTYTKQTRLFSVCFCVHIDTMTSRIDRACNWGVLSFKA